MHTIRMTRDHGEPRTADVHPDEVENYRAAGFEAEGDHAPAAPRLDPAVMEELADGQAKMIATFDHDGDGHPGGSLPKSERSPAKRARKRKAKK